MSLELFQVPPATYPPDPVSASCGSIPSYFLSRAMKNSIRFLMSACVLSIVSCVAMSANVFDTLSAFNPRSTYRWYRIAALQTQASRFEPKGAGRIEEIRVLLAGDSSAGSARVRVFGYEGGAPAPFMSRDLIEPVAVHKSRPGLEWVTVRMPQPVLINQRQFFVAVDQLTPGVVLVTDSDTKPVLCEDQPESFRHQALQTVDGRWWIGKYGFAVDVVMSYEHDPELTWLSDVTASVGIGDTSRVTGGIAWGDYNADTRLDVLVNGRLYENAGSSFVDVTEEVGLHGVPRAGLFMDADNDARLDILFLGSTDTADSGQSILFVARDGGGFEARPLDCPLLLNPTSFSVADADLDGYLDLFVGQGDDASGGPLPNLFLVNDRAYGFVDRTELLYGGSNPPHPSQGSQWVDVDDDGYLDLYVVNQGENASELWRSNGDGTFSIVFGPQSSAPGHLLSVNTVGGHWQHVDGDQRPDLLAPQHSTYERLDGTTESINSILRATDLQAATIPINDEIHGVVFAEKRGSGMWADVDNSGTLDLFLSSASPCRNAHLYTSTPTGMFESRASEFGLLHVPAGPDGVWIDYDGDGRLDLATLVNGYFHLFRNTVDASGNYVAIEVDGADMTGLKVDLFTRDQKITREVASGRGLLMQDPLRLHFGLGDATSVDSVRVRRPGGDEQIFTGLKLNSLNTLRAKDISTAVGTVLADVRAFPNPFNENLTIGFVLKTRADVQVVIFDLQGNRVAEPHSGMLDAGVRNVVWHATGADGNPMPQGTYIYRVIAGSETFNGRVVLGR